MICACIQIQVKKKAIKALRLNIDSCQLLATCSYALYFHCMSSLLGFTKRQLKDSSNLGCVRVQQLKGGKHEGCFDVA